MVLVAGHRHCPGGLTSLQVEVHEMVEQTPAGKEEQTTWEMGG